MTDTYTAELEASIEKLLVALRTIRDSDDPNPMFYRQVAAEAVEDQEGCGI